MKPLHSKPQPKPKQPQSPKPARGKTMPGKAKGGPELQNQELAQLLQENLRPLEPPPKVVDDLFQRILQRTAHAARAWRALLRRAKDKLDD